MCQNNSKPNLQYCLKRCNIYSHPYKSYTQCRDKPIHVSLFLKLLTSISRKYFIKKKRRGLSLRMKRSGRGKEKMQIVSDKEKEQRRKR